MKKLVSVLLAVLMVSLLCGCSGEKKETLNVYNWGVYIGEDVIKNFEKEYNCKVTYSLFSSNEEMYTKLMGGSHYDVIVPSDYMVERLIQENMLQPIDKSIVTNLDLLADGVKNCACDPDNTYFVPYLWGSVGIVYDTTHIDPEKVEDLGYSIFLEPELKGHAFMYDSERDSFMIAFKALGYSMNTDNSDEIEEAYQWLLKVDETIEPDYVTDECIDAMANGEKWIAVVYSGDAAYILDENEDMAFCAPKEGTNIWVDGMVIPANADNPELANKFIKYILDYDASMDNALTVGYASPNKDVLKELSSEGGDYYGNEAYYPRSNYALDENFRHNEVLKKKLSELWIKVKANRK